MTHLSPKAIAARTALGLLAALGLLGIAYEATPKDLEGQHYVEVNAEIGQCEVKGELSSGKSNIDIYDNKDPLGNATHRGPNMSIVGPGIEGWNGIRIAVENTIHRCIEGLP